MSLWSMTGAELSRALAEPAPAAAAAYPGASESLRPVLAAIARLSKADQAALRFAFRAADPARVPSAKPRRLTDGNTFRGWTDFAPALTAARQRACDAGGDRWHLDPALALHARVPVAWVACRLYNGVIKRSPRDLLFPRAQFWPGGALPLGPDYADYLPGATAAPDTGAEIVRIARWTPLTAPDFEMEPTPEDIDAPMAEAAD